MRTAFWRRWAPQWLALAIGLALATLPIFAKDAADARIRGLAARIEGNRILTSFELVDGFGAEVLERVQSGLPTTIDYRIELERQRRLWWNKTLAASKLQVVAMYNALTREYLVNFKQDGALVDSRVVRDLADLRQAMTVFEDLDVAGTEKLPEEGRIRLRARALLGSKTLLSFIPHDVHTSWAESSRLELPEEPAP